MQLDGVRYGAPEVLTTLTDVNDVTCSNPSLSSQSDPPAGESTSKTSPEQTVRMDLHQALSQQKVP